MSKSDYGNMNDPRCIDAINLIKSHVDKFKDSSNIEIEFRLGYFEDSRFNSNIGHVYFDRIKQVLESTKIWAKVVKTESEDFMHKDYRLSVFPDGSEVAIKKERLQNLDFALTGSSYDVRVSFSRETPVPQTKVQSKKSRATNVFKRHKIRTSFVLGDYVSFDLSEVKTEDNGVMDLSYELELELTGLAMLKSKAMTSHYLVHDILLKIIDLVAIVEPLDENPRFEAVVM